MLSVNGISCSLIPLSDLNKEVPVYYEDPQPHPLFRMAACRVNEQDVRNEEGELPNYLVIVSRTGLLAYGQDLVVHVFRNGTPVWDPWYLDRAHIPVTPADWGEPRRGVRRTIGSTPGRSAGFLEVIITPAGADPISMIVPDLIPQSKHVAYFRYWYKPAYDLYKEELACADDLLEQDKLDGYAPLTRKGAAPARSSVEYPNQYPAQQTGFGFWPDGLTPVPNDQYWSTSTPTPHGSNRGVPPPWWGQQG
ncbi:hypothetical protein M413DRAFT_11537 [Hebeloma cylindrosporum]|uniref:Uncharacterized protein n=1 Tax=Hebeloma cylindrosporum TaxID=76867 RepID=A0A0C2XSM3_HEBCY|nr:hypothetical protein M413DRAFT_11537 [Hebeloma cylindrosporum h7]